MADLSTDTDPCPSWCVADHTELFIPGKPAYGRITSHRTETAVAQGMGYDISATGYRCGEARVQLYDLRTHATVLHISPEIGAGVADLLDCFIAADDPGEALRAAAAAIRSTVATVTKP